MEHILIRTGLPGNYIHLAIATITCFELQALFSCKKIKNISY